MPLIPLDLIRIEDDVRHTAPSAEADGALRVSIAALGLLQPVLLDPAGNEGYVVVAGRRRVRTCQALGWAQIEAVIRSAPAEHGQALAIATAENLVRAPLSPVDQWRALRQITDAGYGLAHAAAALGMSERHAARLQKLSGLHPDVIAAIEAGEMPPQKELGIIAGAPPEVQARAMQAAHGEFDEYGWQDVAAQCRTARIPKSRAKFDTATAGVLFEADLFAEGDDAEEYTTDVGGFLAAQKLWLEQHVAAQRATGQKILQGDWKKSSVALPREFEATHLPAGKRPKSAVLFLTLIGDGYHVGEINETWAVKQPAKGKPAKAAPEDDKPTDQAADAPADDVAGDAEGRGPITQAGRDLIAKAKITALTAHLGRHGAGFDPHNLLAYLVLGIASHRYGVRDLAADLVPPEGAADLRGEEAVRCAVAALQELVQAPATPDALPALEWIGQHSGADAALPRFDTPEFLATCAKSLLTGLAGSLGLKPMHKLDGLRKQLTGAAPDWRPPGAEFGAPGPRGRAP